MSQNDYVNTSNYLQYQSESRTSDCNYVNETTGCEVIYQNVTFKEYKEK